MTVRAADGMTPHSQLLCAWEEGGALLWKLIGQRQAACNWFTFLQLAHCAGHNRHHTVRTRLITFVSIQGKEGKTGGSHRTMQICYRSAIPVLF